MEDTVTESLRLSLMESIAATNTEKRRGTMLEFTIKELEDTIRRQTDENARLKEEADKQYNENIQISTVFKDKQMRCIELENEKLALQLQHNRVNRENNLHAERIKMLEVEIYDKTKDYRLLQANFDDKMHDLEIEIITKNALLDREIQKNKYLADKVSLHEEKIDHLLSQVGVSESKFVIQKEQFLKDLDSITRDKDLYKRQYEETVERYEELEERNGAMESLYKQQISNLVSKCDSLGELSIVNDDLDLSSRNSSSMPSSSVINTYDVETADFTEICNQLWLTERKLNQEMTRRVELEQSLSSNTASQMELHQRAEEYDKLLHSYSQTLDKIDQLFIANEEFKRETKAMSAKLANAERELVSTGQKYRDVTSQLQHLLYNKIISPKLAIVPVDDNCTAEEVINNNLVTFDDISQLQSRNIELLAVVRKLSNSDGNYPTSPLKHDNSSNRSESDVSEVLKELSSATEALSSAHEVVNSLTVQRDMLKNLLCSSKVEVSEKIDELLSPSSVNDLKAVISKLEHEKQTLKSELSLSLDKLNQKSNTIASLQGELTENSVKLTQLNTDNNVLGEKCNRLSDKNNILSAEITSNTDQIKSLNNEIVTLRSNIRSVDVELKSKAELFIRASSELLQVKCQLESVKADEAKLMEQLVYAHREIEQKNAILTTVEKIESDMRQRESDLIISLTQDRDLSVKNLEKVREESAATIMSLQRQCRFFEEDISTCNRKLNLSELEICSLREKLLLEQGNSKVALEKTELFDKQNTLLLRKIASLQGVGETNFVTEDELVDRLALEKEKALNEALQAELNSAKLHISELLKFSSGTESKLKDVEEKLKNVNTSNDTEFVRLQNELLNSCKIVEEERIKFSKLQSEYDSMQSTYLNEVNQNTERQNELMDEITILKQKNIEYRNDLEIFKSELIKFQNAAKVAFTNYESEVATRVELEKKMNLFSSNISPSASHQSVLSTEQFDQYDNLRRINEVLHGQVQSLGLQLDRVRNSSKGVDASFPIDLDRDAEIEELKRECRELREVVRYIKREKDFCETKKSEYEIQLAHLKGSLKASQLQLEESRAELLKEIERNNSGRNRPEEFNKLLVEVMQINIVRESNARLVSINQQLTDANNKLKTEIEECKSTTSPLEAQINRLSKENEDLSKYNEVKSNDLATLHRRHEELLGKYKAVDPKAYQALMAQLEGKDLEIERLQKLNEDMDTNNDKLRTRLQDFKNQIATSKKEKVEADERCVDLSSSVDVLTKDLDSAKYEIESLKKESDATRATIESLKKENIIAKNEIEIFKKEAVNKPTVTPAVSTTASSKGSDNGAIVSSLSDAITKKRKESESGDLFETDKSPVKETLGKSLDEMKHQLRLNMSQKVLSDLPPPFPTSAIASVLDAPLTKKSKATSDGEAVAPLSLNPNATEFTPGKLVKKVKKLTKKINDADE